MSANASHQNEQREDLPLVFNVDADRRRNIRPLRPQAESHFPSQIKHCLSTLRPFCQKDFLPTICLLVVLGIVLLLVLMQPTSSETRPQTAAPVSEPTSTESASIETHEMLLLKMQLNGYFITKFVDQICYFRIIPPCRVDDAKIDTLIAYLKLGITPHIREASLNFGNDCPNITDAGLNRFSSQILPLLTNSISIGIDYAFQSITDQGLEHLALDLATTQQNLPKLWLQLYKCMNLTGHGLARFFDQGIAELKSLSTLGLILDHLELSNEAMGQLAQSLSRLQNTLVNLQISLNDCDVITNEGFIQLTSQGVRNLNKLQNLSLEIGHLNIADRAFVQLGSDLSYLNKTLQSLDLWVPTPSITDEGFKQFSSQGLAHLTRLNHLALWFGASNFADGGLKQIGQDIGHLSNSLETLYLAFTNCKQVTDDGFLGFTSEGLTKLTHLKQLYLSYTGTQVSNEALFQLGKDLLVFGKNLKELTIEHPGPLDVEEEKKFKGQIMSRLTSLTTFNFRAY